MSSVLVEAAKRTPELLTLGLVVFLFLQHLDKHDARVQAIMEAQTQASVALAKELAALGAKLDHVIAHGENR